MLVCNVSIRAQRTIAADLVETAVAADDPGTGNIVFATLVDDPASVADLVDAFLGEIMLEPASATATVTVGLAYSLLVDEPANATASMSATTGIVDGAMLESTAASDAPDATVVSALVPRSTMLPDAFINSDGTAREANVNGTMANL